MPWVGSDFQRVHNFSADASASIGITASRFDAEFDNYETGLEACLKLDGTNAPASDFQMGGFRHINVGAAASTNQYLRLDQYQQQTPIFVTFGGDSDVMSVSTSPTFAALVAGHKILVSCPSANTTTSVVIKLNGGSAQPVKHADGSDLSLGDVKGLREYVWTSTNWALMNRRSGGTTENSTNFASTVYFSGSVTFGSAAAFSGSTSFASATIFDGNEQVAVGYRDIPLIEINVGRQLSINDRSKILYHPTTSVCELIIPTQASVPYQIGTAILIQNGVSSGIISVSAASGVVLIRAGTGSIGSRVLSAACQGQLIKVAADGWYIGGAGLT